MFAIVILENLRSQITASNSLFRHKGEAGFCGGLLLVGRLGWGDWWSGSTVAGCFGLACRSGVAGAGVTESALAQNL